MSVSSYISCFNVDTQMLEPLQQEWEHTCRAVQPLALESARPCAASLRQVRDVLSTSFRLQR